MKDGLSKLEIDLDAVEKVVAKKGFKGRFDMYSWGRHDSLDEHKPAGRNFCGTAACLAGWLAICGKHEFKGNWRAEWYNPTHSHLHPVGYDGPFSYRSDGYITMAMEVYGLSVPDVRLLFCSGFDKSLKVKLREARRFIARKRTERKGADE